MPQHEPDSNRTRVRARARRNLVLLVWWAITILGLFALSIGGPWILIIPVGLTPRIFRICILLLIFRIFSRSIDPLSF
jgi:hypothetical protein